MTEATLKTRLRAAVAAVRAAGHTDPVTGEQDVADEMGEAIWNEAGMGGIPGMILAYAGATEPTGFLFCDGASYTTAAQADLFAAIGYTYGGSGANFNVPDLRGRTIVALDNLGGSSANRLTNAQADILGGGAGAENRTPTGTVANHSHTIAHTHTIAHSHTIAHVHVLDHSTAGAQSKLRTAAQIVMNTASGGSFSYVDALTGTAASGSGTSTATRLRGYTAASSAGSSGGSSAGSSGNTQPTFTGASADFTQPYMALTYLIKT